MDVLILTRSALTTTDNNDEPAGHASSPDKPTEYPVSVGGGWPGGWPAGLVHRERKGGGLALIGLLISTAAPAGLEFWAPGLGEITQASAVMAAVGGMRFPALRGFVF